MKMIWAVIRPEFVQRVVAGLDHAGISAMTRIHAPGICGEILPVSFTPPDHPREVIMIAVPDHEVAKAVKAIRTHARIGDAGGNVPEPDPGGKVFVTHIDESFTIRTAGSVNRAS
jgi:nitrogen regulatory protein PII